MPTIRTPYRSVPNVLDLEHVDWCLKSKPFERETHLYAKYLEVYKALFPAIDAHMERWYIEQGVSQTPFHEPSPTFYDSELTSRLPQITRQPEAIDDRRGRAQQVKRPQNSLDSQASSSNTSSEAGKSRLNAAAAPFVPPLAPSTHFKNPQAEAQQMIEMARYCGHDQPRPAMR